ncbi:hypothetical protein Tco_1491127 [Tanacetum coccineum]
MDSCWTCGNPCHSYENCPEEEARRKERVPETYDYRSQYDYYEHDTYHVDYNIGMKDYNEAIEDGDKDRKKLPYPSPELKAALNHVDKKPGKSGNTSGRLAQLGIAVNQTKDHLEKRAPNLDAADYTSKKSYTICPLRSKSRSFKDGDGDGDTHYERSHKGVKASANSDIIFFFTSAQDGNKLLDDERLSLADDLKKAHDQNQNKSK